MTADVCHLVVILADWTSTNRSSGHFRIEFAGWQKESGISLSVKRCFFSLFFRLWRFLCLGWLTDHFSPLTRSHSFSPILNSLRLISLPFVLSLHVSQVFVTSFSLLLLFIHLFSYRPFPHFNPLLSVSAVPIYGQSARAKSPSGTSTESTFPWIQGGMESREQQV